MKGKKVKKGKAKKKDTTWEFEGGIAKVDDESEEEQTPRKRSRTQERDERLRRSRHKLHDAKLKRDFASKMSQRVRFSDILKSETQASEQSDSDAQDEDDNMYVEDVPKVQRSRSNISVLDRLQRLWSQSTEHNNSSLKSRKTKPVQQDSSQVSPTKASVNFYTQPPFSEDLQLIFHSTATFECKVPNIAQIDDNVSINDENGDLLNTNSASSSAIDHFQAYFNKPMSSLESTSKLTHWQKVIFAGHEYSLLVSKSQKDKVLSFPAFATIQELPGLHKLWRNHTQSLPITPFAKYTLPSLSLYQDVFVEGRDMYNDSVMLETMLMHSLFHVLKARSKVVKHNQKLKQRRRDTAMSSFDDPVTDEPALNKGKISSRKRKANSDAISSAAPMKRLSEEEENAYRDQGFVRPRLLILVPFRHMARSIIEKMITILGENTSVSGLEKLQTEYGDPAPEDDTNNQFLQGNKKSKKPVERKPADWEASFQDKNVDDDFRMGIQVNPSQGKGSGAEKGAYLRLYSDFYISDIILASPIGLKLAMETTKNGQSRIDCDFLNSIEQVVIHQADILAMQNWEHLDYLFRHMNLMPKDSHDDTDYARVRPYFLEGQGAKYRQVMLTTQGNTPEIQAFFREFALSHAGQMKWRRNWEEGVIGDVFVSVKQVFQVLPRNVSSLAESEERRWLNFQDQILSPILRLRQKRTLIVAPSYLHFVRIRNYLLEQEANAAFLSEYSSESEISRSRVMYYQGLKDILLYSGRAHFFRRFRIRGARHVVFYSLPEQAHFYPEIVNMLSLVFEDVKKKKVEEDDEEGAVANSDDFATEMSCITLCSHYEQMALERILGQKKSEQMLLSDKNTFVFF